MGRTTYVKMQGTLDVDMGAAHLCAQIYFSWLCDTDFKYMPERNGNRHCKITYIFITNRPWCLILTIKSVAPSSGRVRQS